MTDKEDRDDLHRPLEEAAEDDEQAGAAHSDLPGPGGEGGLDPEAERRLLEEDRLQQERAEQRQP